MPKHFILVIYLVFELPFIDIKRYKSFVLYLKNYL